MIQHENIHIIKGTAPILISAPHAVPIKKKEQGNPHHVKRGELHVATIVREICRMRGAWGIFTQGEGPLKNWRKDAYSVYKKNTKHLVRSHNIELVIDIHGARSSRPFFIDYDFVHPERHPHDEILEQTLLSHLQENFPENKISNGFFRDLNGDGKVTLTHYVRRNLNIPAVQLEINRKLRSEDDKLKHLIQLIDSFLSSYENTSFRFQQKKEGVHR